MPVSWYGDVQIGQEVGFEAAIVTAGEPERPDDVPVLSLFHGSTLIGRYRMPADAQPVRSLVFRRQVFLDASFPDSGLLTGHIQATVGGSLRIVPVAVRVVPGGNPNGTVNSMAFVRRPSSPAIIWTTDAGTIFRGTNPKVEL